MTRALAFSLLGFALAVSEPVAPAVRLDVVVTTAAGLPIVDLRPGDFELRENGVVRPITGVELRSVPRAAPPASAPILSEDDERQAARIPGTRVFAFILDEFHVESGGPSSRVRDALARFIDTHVGPADLALAIKPLENVAGARFTRDRQRLRTAVDSFEGRKGDYTPRSSFERQYIGHAPSAVETARSQIVSAALRETSLRLGEMGADRGVIVLVSDGFARSPANRQARVPDLQGFVRAASRFHLVLYAFRPSDAEAAQEPSSATLDWLASQTGGRAILDGARLEEGFRQMAADLDTYYAVTYQPAQADGRFHTLELVTRRRNAQVRARPGYWAILGSELRALTDIPPPAVRRALRRSTAVNIWTGTTVGADGHTQLTVTWEPGGGHDPAMLKVNAATADGRALFEGTLAPVGTELPHADTRATFDVPPGRVELDISILSMAGATIDTDVRDVDVPDLSKRARGPLILTPEIVRARTMPEYRSLIADPQAAPTPSRVFSRGDRLLITVPVWDAAGSPVRATLTVANEIGGPMRAITPVSAPAPASPRFELPLAWLAPGEYQLLLGATSPNGEAREWVRFSVR